MIYQPLPRRTFLRGMGTAMALPFLEAMAPLSALAKTAGRARPLRLAFLFVPNGIHMPAWKPKTEGPLTELPSILEPLKNVRESLTVLTGLTQNHARPNGDGPGDHARSAAAWLTGCQPRKTDGADIKVGTSADQLAAMAIGSQTQFPSLELGCERGRQAGNCDSGYSCVYSGTIAWHSASSPVAKEVDPRLVFERLFSNGDPYETAENRVRREREKRSILDFVTGDAAKLTSRLGAHDRSKLDEYLTGVREIEHRLERAQQVSLNPPRPGEAQPGSAPVDFGEHVRLMGDMMVLAFQADLTRVCTFMLANEGSNRPYSVIGIPEGHHDLSHHMFKVEKQEKIRQINHFHALQVAYILEKMQAVKEGDSTLLDNSMVVYGGGISDGNRHNHDDLPILVAGKGGGTIKTGRHIVYPFNTPLNNLFLSLLDRMDVPVQTIGDSTGKLQGLF